MAQDDDQTRLKRLEERIAQAKTGSGDRPSMGKDFSQAEMAWRLVIELVSGIGIGFGIGYGLDALFGTKPFLMVVFVLLGLVAGIRTMMRSATEIQAKRKAAEAASDEGK